MEAVRAANVLAGTDKDCTNWIKTYKDFKPGMQASPAPVQVNAPGDGAAAGGRRRGGREARMGRG
jgi:5-methyltetrahydrofolate--homocysteine methyltransferase